MKDLPSLRSRVTAGTALLILLVFAATLLGVTAMRSLDISVQTELTALRERTVLSQAVTRNVVALMQAGSDEAGADPALQRAGREAAVASLRESLADYRQSLLLSDDEIRSLDEMDRIAAGLDAGGDHAGRLASLFDQVAGLAAAQDGAAARRAQELASASEARRRQIWYLFAVAVLIGIGSSVATVRAVILPVSRLVDATERVGAGDLRPIDLGAMPRELGQLAATVRRMSDGLRSVVGAVADVSAALTDHASQLSRRSADLTAHAAQVSRAIGAVSQSAERQAGATRDTDVLLGDLRAAAARSAAAGQRVVSVSDSIRRIAATHQDQLGAASATLLELHEVVGRTTDSVDRLSSAAGAVSEFVTLTGELAAQTELLSLNAAIEAARAGASGEGFAVVAAEIRDLAETSAEGARRIARTVSGLNDQMSSVASTVAAGRERVSGVEDVAEGVTRALADIVGAIEEVSQAAGTVAREAAAHRELADRLAALGADVARAARGNAQAAQHVSDSAADQSAATQEIAAAADRLVATADRLTTLVRGFRV